MYFASTNTLFRSLSGACIRESSNEMPSIEHNVGVANQVQIVKPKRIKVTVTVQVGGGGFGEPSYAEAKEVRLSRFLSNFGTSHVSLLPPTA